MKRVLLLMIVAIAVGALASTAHANMILTLDDPSTLGVDVTIMDGVAPDSTPADGLLGVNAVFGNWTITDTDAISQLFYGGPVPQMHLNNLSASSSTGGTLIIGLTDTGLSLSFPSPTYVMESVYGGALASNTTGDIQLWQILDPDDTPFADQTSADPDSTNNLVLDSTLIATPPANFSDTISGSKVNPGGTFSLTEWVVIHHDGAGTTSFDIHSTVVPVPGAVLLGILGLGVAGWKLRKYA